MSLNTLVDKYNKDYSEYDSLKTSTLKSMIDYHFTIEKMNAPGARRTVDETNKLEDHLGELKESAKEEKHKLFLALETTFASLRNLRNAEVSISNKLITELRKKVSESEKDAEPIDASYYASRPNNLNKA